jgi:uncharacterized protein (DUF1330 family)
MKGYLIANITVTDPAKFEEYRKAVPPLIAAHGGRYLIRGGKTEAVEGTDPFRRLVVLEFPSLAAAKAFYESPEYAPVLKLRLEASESQVVLVEGFSVKQ